MRLLLCAFVVQSISCTVFLDKRGVRRASAWMQVGATVRVNECTDNAQVPAIRIFATHARKQTTKKPLAPCSTHFHHSFVEA